MHEHDFGVWPKKTISRLWKFRTIEILIHGNKMKPCSVDSFVCVNLSIDNFMEEIKNQFT